MGCKSTSCASVERPATAPPASSRRRSRHRRDADVTRASAADNQRTGRSAPNRPHPGPSTLARRAAGRASALHAMRARPRRGLRSPGGLVRIRPFLSFSAAPWQAGPGNDWRSCNGHIAALHCGCLAISSHRPPWSPQCPLTVPHPNPAVNSCARTRSEPAAPCWRQVHCPACSRSNRRRASSRPSARRRRGAGRAAGPLSSVLAQQQGPAVITAERLRPQVRSGAMSGDTTRDAAMLWSQTDRVARMVGEYSAHENFKNAQTITGPLALARNDYTARVDLRGLPVAQRLYYRVRFQDLQHKSAWSEPVTGSLIIAGGSGRDISFAFSGDEAGQGWGINEAWGGYRVYETMRRFQPDFFIHSGDQIYADGPIQAEVTLDDGSI